ncbi:uncharacterized protein [Ptychodera flava]|uniref:uncharacterized protein n=1 Tax=Ptychodera flava TaxID=63121 RepID=UPI003969C54E
MASLTKKQADSWLILKKQIDMFVKKTNLEVAAVMTFYDKVSSKRKFLVHGTDVLQQSLATNVEHLALPPVPAAPFPLHISPAQPATDASNAAPNLPDIRETPQGCLTKLSFAELRHLIPTIVKNSVSRNQALWGSQENAPVWWPTDVPYQNPCKRPKEVTGWTDLLRRAAKACYEYYQQHDLMGDHPDDTPLEMDHITNSNAQEDAISEIPALQQLVQHYSTLNETDLELLNIQSTPEMLHVQPSTMSLSSIPHLEESTINTDGSLSFDQEASVQGTTQSDQSFPYGFEEMQQVETSQSPSSQDGFEDMQQVETSQSPSSQDGFEDMQQVETSQSPSSQDGFEEMQQVETSQSPSSQVTRRSQRKSKKTARAQDYVMQVKRRRR